MGKNKKPPKHSLVRTAARTGTSLVIALAAILATDGATNETLKSGALSGNFEIGGQTAVDLSPDAPLDTRLRIHLTGNAAKALYDSMPVDADPSACTDGLSKSIGDMECAIVDGEYECWFAIDIKAQTIQGGWVC